MNMIESTRKVHNDLIEFLEKLTPERHQYFIDLLFPKYLSVDGKDFVFGDRVTKTMYSGETKARYCWVDYADHTLVFPELNGDVMKALGLSNIIVGCMGYINTLSSSDVEKIKKLVYSDGTIYPLVEIYITETQYIQYLITQQQYRATTYTPTISEAIVLYIRENPTKEINYNWFHPDISYFSWSETYRHYLHLSIMDLCDEKVGMLNNRECDTIYNITKEHCLSKMNPDEIAFMTSVATVCDNHIPHSPSIQILMGLPNELLIRHICNNR